MSRDPIGEEGGRNLYEFVQNGSPNSIDAKGLECTSTSGGIRYRVSIALLDANQQGTPYATGASTWINNWNNDAWVQLWNINIPTLTSSGAYDYKNPAFQIPNGPSVPSDFAGLAVFLFYIDFDVCGADCKVEVWEDRQEERWDGSQWNTVPVPNGGGMHIVATGPPWVANLACDRKTTAISGSTHTIVVTDMPGANSFLKAGMGIDKLFRRIYATQEVKVIDSETGSEVNSISHDFKIGYDENGVVYASP